MNYEKKIKHEPAKVLQEAIHFFGPGGMGLDIVEQDETHASFEGGGGYVYVRFREEEKSWQVEVETREWDYNVQKFLEKI